MIDLAVIGSGPAGYEAAAHAAKLGMSVLLFEKGALGGVCLNVGCIPTKTFLRSAKIFSDCKEAQRYGVTVESPSLDMSAVQERKRSVIATLAKGVSSMLKQAGVKVIEAEAIVRRSGLVEAGGDTYEVKNILVATGSMPALPPIPGLAESAAVMDSSGILEVAEIPRSLVVIGAGVIGLEFACFFAEFGTRVTLIEMLDRIAPVVDAEIAGKLQRELKRKAVTFNLSSTVSKVDGDVVHVVDGDGEE